MAYPQVRSDIRYGAEISNVTSHPISLPTDAEVGDLILVFFGVDANETITIDTVYSGVAWSTEGSLSTSTNSAAIFSKISEGADNDYLQITTGSEMASYVSYAIYDYYSTDPITCSYGASGASTNMNPPSLPVTYSGRDSLWFVFGSMDGLVYATAAPTDFTNLITAAGSSSQGVTCSVAQREYNTTGSYDPGTFTNDTEDWVTFTLIVNGNPPTGIGISTFGYYNLS